MSVDRKEQGECSQCNIPCSVDEWYQLLESSWLKKDAIHVLDLFGKDGAVNITLRGAAMSLVFSGDTKAIETFLQQNDYPTLTQLRDVRFFLDEEEDNQDTKLRMLFYKRLYDDQEMETDEGLGEGEQDLSKFLSNLCSTFDLSRAK